MSVCEETVRRCDVLPQRRAFLMSFAAAMRATRSGLISRVYGIEATVEHGRLTYWVSDRMLPQATKTRTNRRRSRSRRKRKRKKR